MITQKGATAAVEFALGGEALVRRSRKPEIMADAAHAIFLCKARRYTGNFVLDEDIRTDFRRLSIRSGGGVGDGSVRRIWTEHNQREPRFRLAEIHRQDETPFGAVAIA